MTDKRCVFLDKGVQHSFCSKDIIIEVLAVQYGAVHGVVENKGAHLFLEEVNDTGCPGFMRFTFGSKKHQGSPHCIFPRAGILCLVWKPESGVTILWGAPQMTTPITEISRCLGLI